MKITIQGAQGSGKSTVAKLLATELGFDHYSVGGLMRQMAEQRKLSLLELSRISETDGGTVDKELDTMAQNLGREKNNFVMDGRLGYYFIPDSFKVYLDVQTDEATRRIFLNRRPGEKENSSIERTKKNILRRKESERIRYKKYYGIEYPPREGMDLIIDTTNMAPEDVVATILKALPRRNTIKKSL